MEILKKLWGFLADSLQTLLLAASIFLVIYIFFFRPFQVNGVSMFPTFKNGEYILTNLITLRLSPLKRGDVIVFIAPTDSTKDFIKRIIGLPGEKVYLHDGYVYVNDAKLNESAYLGPDIRSYAGAYLKEDSPIIIPQGEYFVMGDNRPESSDSREFGPIHVESVIGKSFFVYWPANVMRVVTNPYSK
jgi:signal peptidase I